MSRLFLTLRKGSEDTISLIGVAINFARVNQGTATIVGTEGKGFPRLLSQRKRRIRLTTPAPAMAKRNAVFTNPEAKRLHSTMALVESKMICFNVGGTKYEVARSTIEKYPDTMLSRLISKDWQQGSEISIDRDGARFRFVLDYMRDQKVHLPLTVPRDALLQELVYFGFDSVPADAICSKSAAIDATKNMILCNVVNENVYAANLKEIDKEMKALTLKEECTKIAFEAFTMLRNETQTGNLSLSVIDHREICGRLKRSRLQTTTIDLLNGCLAQYGLRYESHKNYNVRFKPLE